MAKPCHDSISLQYKRERIISASVSRRLLVLEFNTSRLAGSATSIGAKWEKWPRHRWETRVQPQRPERFKTWRVCCFCHRRQSILGTRSTTADLNSRRLAAFTSTTRWPPLFQLQSSVDLQLEQFFFSLSLLQYEMKSHVQHGRGMPEGKPARHPIDYVFQNTGQQVAMPETPLGQGAPAPALPGQLRPIRTELCVEPACSLATSPIS